MTIRHQSEGESSATTKKGQPKETKTSSDAAAERARCEELEKITINNDDDKYFQVGVHLPPWEKEELVVFLRKNIDVFA